MTYKNFKIIFIAVLVSLLFGFGSASAQSSLEFLTSWQAQNYAPLWYGGKTMPIPGSKVDVNLELLNSGKPVDLSWRTIRWYVNDELVKNEDDGLGITSLEIIVPNGSNRIGVRTAILNYGGQTLNNTVYIPVVSPEVVIDSPYSGNKIKAGLSVFEAVPFFFNILNKSDLTIEWLANSNKAGGGEGDPWKLELGVNNSKSGAKINLTASAKNPLGLLEMASQNIILEMK